MFISKSQIICSKFSTLILTITTKTAIITKIKAIILTLTYGLEYYRALIIVERFKDYKKKI
jgi:hypothetical protein